MKKADGSLPSLVYVNARLSVPKGIDARVLRVPSAEVRHAATDGEAMQALIGSGRPPLPVRSRPDGRKVLEVSVPVHVPDLARFGSPPFPYFRVKLVLGLDDARGRVTIEPSQIDFNRKLPHGFGAHSFQDLVRRWGQGIPTPPSLEQLVDSFEGDPIALGLAGLRYRCPNPDDHDGAFLNAFEETRDPSKLRDAWQKGRTAPGKNPKALRNQQNDWIQDLNDFYTYVQSELEAASGRT